MTVTMIVTMIFSRTELVVSLRAGLCRVRSNRSGRLGRVVPSRVGSVNVVVIVMAVVIMWSW